MNAYWTVVYRIIPLSRNKPESFMSEEFKEHIPVVGSSSDITYINITRVEYQPV